MHLLAGSVKEVVHGAAVLATKLLGHLSQLSHALLPVVELLHRAFVLVVAALGIGLVDEGLDLFLPAGEDRGVVDDQAELWPALADALALSIAQWVEDDVALEGLLGLHEFLGELVEGLLELLLLVILAHLPVLRVHPVEHGLVDVVDQSLEHGDGVLGDFAEEDRLVVGDLLVDFLTRLCVSHEEDTFATKFDVVAYGIKSDQNLTLNLIEAH